MRHKVYVTDIDWDIDDVWRDEDDPSCYPELGVAYDVDLPCLIEITVNDKEVDINDPEALDDYISLWLSDNYGYCPNGFSFDVVWDYDDVR